MKVFWTISFIIFVLTTVSCDPPTDKDEPTFVPSLSSPEVTVELSTPEKVPTWTPEPTKTPWPAAEPTKVPAPTETPTITAEEETYFANIVDWLLLYSEAMDTQTTLFENANFASETWLEEIGAVLDSMLILNALIRELDCPTSCMAIHQHLLAAADHYDTYVTPLATAMIALDVDGITDAGTYLRLGNAEIEKANSEVERFNRDRGVE